MFKQLIDTLGTGEPAGFSRQRAIGQIGSVAGSAARSQFHQQVAVDAGRRHFGAVVR